MKKFFLSEQEKKEIKHLYNLTEDSKYETLIKGVSDYLKGVSTGEIKSIIEPLKSTEDKDEKTSKSDIESKDDLDDDDTTTSVDVSNIAGLNDNEKIVLSQLKSDGFTDEASAAVMGVVGGESGFKTFKEASYRNTANSRIRAIFPSKLGKLSDQELDRLKQSDETFFNAVYGGMYGNAPNEGWKYVGRGFNGITFKANYEAAKKCTGIDFVGQPKLLEDPKYAAKALSCYFKVVKDIDNFEQAFREAFRQNAGPGNSWEYYANSTNPVAKTGIPLKRGKAQQYYKYIKGKSV